MAEVNLWVLGTLNLSSCETTASGTLPVPNLKVMMSGCFFLAVILRMEISVCLYLTRPHPALSDSSLSTIKLSAVTTMWLHGHVTQHHTTQNTISQSTQYLEYRSWWSLISVAGNECSTSGPVENRLMLTIWWPASSSELETRGFSIVNQGM